MFADKNQRLRSVHTPTAETMMWSLFGGNAGSVWGPWFDLENGSELVVFR